MLAGVLKNEIAIQVSISIIRAFIEMRRFISLNGQIFQEISDIKGQLLEHDKKFDEVFDELQRKQETEFKQSIFFDGQIYDAYSLIVDIIKSAKKKIIIIDNYHDRFILIDGTELYHCGASLKDLGKKCFAINKIEDSKFIKFVEQII